MSTSNPSPIVPPPRRRRWWRVILVILGLPLLGLIGWMTYAYFSLQSDWRQAEAETDLLDPRWRLMDIEADRAAIPDKDNSALLIIALTRPGKGILVMNEPNYDAIFNLPPTTQLNGQQVKIIRAELAKLAKPLEEARKLKNMPNGRFPIDYSDDWMSTLIPHQQNMRNLTDWLKHDAYLLAQERKTDEAVQACQAILNTGRAIGDEPFLTSLLIRVAMQTIATTTLERVLAQGHTDDETLHAMQKAVELEAQNTHWLQAVRGERAGSHHLFENIRSGKLKLSAFMGRGGAPSFGEQLFDQFPTVMLKYYPEYLRHQNRLVEISRLPIHERHAKIKDWADDASNSTNMLIGLLTRGIGKVHLAECRSQAMLRSTIVALACERYRLKHKDNLDANPWPATLDVLVKEKLLDAVPTDPMDNQPLRYRRTKDGVVIYSIGIDMTDNGGAIDRDKGPHEPGQDIGFRLWNVERRRQPALPPVVIPEKEQPQFKS